MKFIETKKGTPDAVKISYEDYGQGKPIVLIHGWPLSKEMWEYQLEPLVNAGFRVVKYDRRGFGKSDKPWDNYDYDTLTDDLRTLIEELDLQDVTLVGFSMGAGEVARYFGKYGNDRISKAVLISGVTPYMAAELPQEKMDEMMDGVVNDRIGFLDDFGKQFFGVNLLSHPVSTPLLEYYRMLASFASGRSTRECMKSFANTDFTQDVVKINVPALIIHGSADKTVPIDISAEKTAKLMPAAQYIIYEDAPHGLFYTHRERLNADLISFIGSGKIDEQSIREETVLLPSNEALITR